jgi:hypothetical protein
MNWSNVTVFQWQQLMQLFTQSESEDLEAVSIKVISIITGKTETEVMNLPLNKTIKLAKKIEFLKTDVPVNKVDFIKVKGKRYRCNYNIKDIEAARYIETKYFSGDFAGNIHKIAASMVIPQRFTIFGWKDNKYQANKHDEYADDLLTASIVDVMGSVVFFYLVFRTWIKVSQDYLKKDTKKMKMTEGQTEMILQVLCDSMDGFTNASWLQSMKKLHLSNPLNYQPSIS